MSESFASFVLSRVISAHSSDLKSVVATPSRMLVTASRDSTVKIFSEKSGDYSEVVNLKQSDKLALNSVAFYQASSGWLIFAGRMDGTISVFSMGSYDAVRVVRLHSKNVCVLYVDALSGQLVSGSWDNNAVVSHIDQLMVDDDYQGLRLEGHNMAVWAVSSVPDRPEHYLTGSADTTIKLWHGDSAIQTFSGHEDVVRCIAALSSRRFVSGSNDFTVRMWDIEMGACLAKYTSTTCEFIFGMTVVNKGTQQMLAICGESGFVELWTVVRGEQLSHQQVIHTPAQSAWTIAALHNGDIVIGANNGNAYVFTTEESRKAPNDQLTAFDATVAKNLAETQAMLAAQQQEMVKIKIALGEGEPDMELRYKKGSDPEQAAETFLKENNMPYAYLSEITEYIKANVPEARIAARKKLAGMQPAQRVMVDGQEWDYVFDVTTEDGRSLQLPYNIGEDPNMAARRFVDKQHLPLQFMDKVASLLRMQVPEASLGDRAASYIDPFTGQGRYVPGSETSNTAVASSDPFTNAGRYVPNDSTQQQTHTSAISDKSRPQGELVPLREFFRFGSEKASAKALLRLKETNAKQEYLKLNEQQMSALEEILTKSEFEPTDAHVSAIDAGLQWSTEEVVPVLDAFRLALLNRRFNEIYCVVEVTDGQKSRAGNTLDKLNAFLNETSSDPVRILACRAIANAAIHEWGRAMLLSVSEEKLISLIAQLHNPKAAVQLAVTSAVANWALVLLTTNTETAHAFRRVMIQALIKGMDKNEHCGNLSELAKIRLLQAIVTVMWGDVVLIQKAKEVNVVGLVNRIKDSVSAESGKAVARDIVEMVYAL